MRRCDVEVVRTSSCPRLKSVDDSRNRCEHQICVDLIVSRPTCVCVCALVEPSVNLGARRAWLRIERSGFIVARAQCSRRGAVRHHDSS